MIYLDVHPSFQSANVIEALKRVAAAHPGEHEIRVVIAGQPRSTLTLGPEWRVEDTPQLRAALAEFGGVGDA